MTKEELRERILELEDRMSKEDSRKAVSEMNDEWEELSNNLENILYEELEGMALKVITEKIIERYDIDTDILMSEYMDNGDLEKAFTAAAEECDCGWKEDIKKVIVMTKEGFIKLIENAQNYNKELDRWSDFGIDLFELPISELGWNFLNVVLPELFSDEGVDWINWWLFEKPGFGGDPNQAYDEDGNVIPTDTIDDLWNIVKDYQK